MVWGTSTELLLPEMCETVWGPYVTLPHHLRFVTEEEPSEMEQDESSIWVWNKVQRRVKNGTSFIKKGMVSERLKELDC